MEEVMYQVEFILEEDHVVTIDASETEVKELLKVLAKGRGFIGLLQPDAKSEVEKTYVSTDKIVLINITEK